MSACDLSDRRLGSGCGALSERQGVDVHLRREALGDCGRGDPACEGDKAGWRAW